MSIKPLGKRVVIKKLKAEEKTVSGIVLPSQAQEKPQMAEVISLGTEIKDEDGIKVGDRVIFKKFSGTDVKFEGEEVTIIEIANLLGIIE